MQLARFGAWVKSVCFEALAKKKRRSSYAFLVYCFAVFFVFFLPISSIGGYGVPPVEDSNNEMVEGSNNALSAAVRVPRDQPSLAASYDFEPISPTATLTGTATATYLPASSGKVVPILMYHYIRINPDPSDTIGAGLSVAPQEFERQMHYLVDNNYNVIGLEDLAYALREGKPLPDHAVVLTFDDGYLDFYQAAYPILKRYGLAGTSFVITGFVGRGGYLTWEAITEMAASGLVSFGAHTVNHPDLTRIPLSDADRQIRQSKQALESHLNTNVNLFAYPSGQFNASVAQLVENAGFVTAVSTRYGNLHQSSDLFRLKRIRIDGRDNFAAFVNRLRYYDPGLPYGLETVAPAIKPTATSLPRATPSATPNPKPTPTIRAVKPSSPSPVPTISANAVVPNLVGLSESDARSRLAAVGLQAGYTNYQSANDVRPENRGLILDIAIGSVISQQPGPGTVLKKGDKVNLAVRKQ